MTDATLMEQIGATGVRIPAPAVRHQQLIVTLYGLYSREPGSALPVAALVALLGDLGYDAPGVRSAVSRLKAKGVLRSTRRDGVAAYELSGSLQTVFAEGDQRIFSDRRDNGSHDWLLALFSVPESQRHLRHRLRSLLTGLGFGTVGSGAWIATADVLDRTRERLGKEGLEDFVEFFRGDYLFSGDVRRKVAQWWDLESIDALFGEFLDDYAAAGQEWAAVIGEEPAEAMRDEGVCLDAFHFYVPMLTVWRRLPYRDPNLPLDYMPDGWKEPEARRVFVSTHRLLAPLAARHAQRIIANHRP